jgi:hypothetical protein
MKQLDTISRALAMGLCVQLTYGGHDRVVEVHAYGCNKDDKPIVRVWQVHGNSTSGASSGWKLLRLNEAQNLVVLDQPSQAPRLGYKPRDKAMQQVIAEVRVPPTSQESGDAA